MGYPLIYKGTEPVVRMPVGAIDSAWVRPASWPTLPDISGQQKIVGVYAVENTDSNFVAVLAATSVGTYTVDWGDGTTSTGITSNTQAQKQYTYSSLSGYPEWNGYRLVIITITPNTGNLTSISLQRKHTQANLQNNMIVNWLELDANIPNASSFAVGGGTTVSLAILQSVKIRSSIITNNASTMFRGCYKLENVILTGIQNPSNCSQMFFDCHSLKYGPELNTANCSNFDNMFANCFSLQSIPKYNTSNGTSFNTMFGNCKQLQAIPLIDTAKGLYFSSMFSGCNSLITIPLLNTAAGLSFFSMFLNCNSLITIPAINTGNGTNFSGMFSTCGSLKSIPLLNTSKGTDFSSMFVNDVSLIAVPNLDTGNALTTQSMFQACYNLQTIPDLNTIKVTNAASMFQDCRSLLKSPTINLSLATSIANIFNGCFSLIEISSLNCNSITAAPTIPFLNCRSLAKVATTNLRYTHSYISCKLSKNALVNIFNNLPTITGQTITITGNWGASLLSAAERAIATGKGWTISG